MKYLLLICSLLWTTSLDAAETWTRFRGQNGAGRSELKGIPHSWQAEDYRWSRKLPGVGHSSPVSWGARVLITSGDEASGQRHLLAIDADKGSTLWQCSFEDLSHRKHQLNSFASGTPTVDSNGIYLGWGTPDNVTIVAVKHDGTVRWKKQLGPFKSGHGFGVSLTLYKDLLIIPNEHEGQSRLLALSTADGSIRWQVERESRVSYATPCIHKNGSRDELIFVNWHYGITAVDPASGAQLWQADVFDKSHIESSIASPIIAGGLVLGVSGWLGHGNEVIAVQPPPVGSDEAPRQVYRISRGAPLCTTPLVQDDLLFLWSDNGVVTAADSQTGKIHWQKRIGGTFYSSPICLDGAIYNIDVNGKVTVLKAAAEYQQLGSCSLGDPCHSTPAIGHGRLYLRTFTTLSALDPQP